MNNKIRNNKKSKNDKKNKKSEKIVNNKTFHKKKKRSKKKRTLKIKKTIIRGGSGPNTKNQEATKANQLMKTIENTKNEKENMKDAMEKENEKGESYANTMYTEFIEPFEGSPSLNIDTLIEKLFHQQLQEYKNKLQEEDHLKQCIRTLLNASLFKNKEKIKINDEKIITLIIIKIIIKLIREKYNKKQESLQDILKDIKKDALVNLVNYSGRTLFVFIIDLLIKFTGKGTRNNATGPEQELGGRTATRGGAAATPEAAVQDDLNRKKKLALSYLLYIINSDSTKMSKLIFLRLGNTKINEKLDGFGLNENEKEGILSLLKTVYNNQNNMRTIITKYKLFGSRSVNIQEEMEGIILDELEELKELQKKSDDVFDDIIKEYMDIAEKVYKDYKDKKVENPCKSIYEYDLNKYIKKIKGDTSEDANKGRNLIEHLLGVVKFLDGTTTFQQKGDSEIMELIKTFMEKTRINSKVKVAQISGHDIDNIDIDSKYPVLTYKGSIVSYSDVLKKEDGHVSRIFKIFYKEGENYTELSYEEYTEETVEELKKKLEHAVKKKLEHADSIYIFYGVDDKHEDYNLIDLSNYGDYYLLKEKEKEKKKEKEKLSEDHSSKKSIYETRGDESSVKQSLIEFEKSGIGLDEAKIILEPPPAKNGEGASNGTGADGGEGERWVMGGAGNGKARQPGNGEEEKEEEKEAEKKDVSKLFYTKPFLKPLSGQMPYFSYPFRKKVSNENEINNIENGEDVFSSYKKLSSKPDPNEEFICYFKLSNNKTTAIEKNRNEYFKNKIKADNELAAKAVEQLTTNTNATEQEVENAKTAAAEAENAMKDAQAAVKTAKDEANDAKTKLTNANHERDKGFKKNQNAENKEKVALATKLQRLQRQRQAKAKAELRRRQEAEKEERERRVMARLNNLSERATRIYPPLNDVNLGRSQ